MSSLSPSSSVLRTAVVTGTITPKHLFRSSKICRGSQTSGCRWLSGRSNKGRNPLLSVRERTTVVVQHLNFVERSLSSFPLNDRESNSVMADKKNPKYPDFKHKDTGEALWVEGRYNPPWAKSQLAILDTGF